MKELYGIKTPGKIYISDNTKYGNTYLDTFLINGDHPKPTFDKYWFCVDSEPSTVQQSVSQPYINYRFELKEIALESDKIPKLLKREEAQIDTEDGWEWREEYKDYASLYKPMSDKQDDAIEDVEFTYTEIMSLKGIDSHDGFSYDVQRTQWKPDGKGAITEKSVEHQQIDKIVFPSLVLASRPCSLTPEQTYKIIREHILSNLNGAVAKITSDYDFCFTVKKRVKLVSPKKYTVDVNNGIFQKRKRKSKYQERTQTETLVEIFEMTPNGYRGYSTVKGFVGNNQTELKNNIDSYLKELMDFINSPLVQCSHCNGEGSVYNKELTNDT